MNGSAWGPAPVRSLGLRTDLACLTLEGSVEQFDGYVVARCPQEPTYYWGNLLAFPNPPGPGDERRWPELFREHFGADPRVTHMTFTWDAEGRGMSAPFAAMGFDVENDVCLTATSVHRPEHHDSTIEVRPIATDDEWEAVIACALREGSENREQGYTDEFTKRRYRTHRRVVERGHGVWFGAFDAARLVGDLGIVTFDGIARYRNVQTHPEHRGRGVCQTLVCEAARHCLAQTSAATLIICTEENSVAHRAYARVGFRPSERRHGMCKLPD